MNSLSKIEFDAFATTDSMPLPRKEVPTAFRKQLLLSDVFRPNVRDLQSKYGIDSDNISKASAVFGRISTVEVSKEDEAESIFDQAFRNSVHKFDQSNALNPDDDSDDSNSCGTFGAYGDDDVDDDDDIDSFLATSATVETRSSSGEPSTTTDLSESPQNSQRRSHNLSSTPLGQHFSHTGAITEETGAALFDPFRIAAAASSAEKSTTSSNREDSSKRSTKFSNAPSSSTDLMMREGIQGGSTCEKPPDTGRPNLTEEPGVALFDPFRIVAASSAEKSTTNRDDSFKVSTKFSNAPSSSTDLVMREGIQVGSTSEKPLDIGRSNLMSSGRISPRRSLDMSASDFPESINSTPKRQRSFMVPNPSRSSSSSRVIMSSTSVIASKGACKLSQMSFIVSKQKMSDRKNGTPADVTKPSVSPPHPIQPPPVGEDIEAITRIEAMNERHAAALRAKRQLAEATQGEGERKQLPAKTTDSRARPERNDRDLSRTRSLCRSASKERLAPSLARSRSCLKRSDEFEPFSNKKKNDGNGGLGPSPLSKERDCKVVERRISPPSRRDSTASLISADESQPEVRLKGQPLQQPDRDSPRRRRWMPSPSLEVGDSSHSSNPKEVRSNDRDSVYKSRVIRVRSNSDDFDQQMDQLAAARSKTQRGRSASVEDRSRSVSPRRRSERRGQTRANLVNQSNDGTMVIDGARAQQIIADLVAKKTKEKTELILAKAKQEESNDHAKLSKTKGPLPGETKTVDLSKTKGPPGETKATDATGSTKPIRNNSLEEVSQKPKASKNAFLKDLLGILDSGDPLAEADHVRIIIPVIIKKLNSKHGLSLSGDDTVAQKGVASVIRSIALSSQTDGLIETMSDKQLVEDTVQKLVEIVLGADVNASSWSTNSKGINSPVAADSSGTNPRSAGESEVGGCAPAAATVEGDRRKKASPNNEGKLRTRQSDASDGLDQSAESSSPTRRKRPMNIAKTRTYSRSLVADSTATAHHGGDFSIAVPTGTEPSGSVSSVTAGTNATAARSRSSIRKERTILVDPASPFMRAVHSNEALSESTPVNRSPVDGRLLPSHQGGDSVTFPTTGVEPFGSSPTMTTMGSSAASRGRCSSRRERTVVVDPAIATTVKANDASLSESIPMPSRKLIMSPSRAPSRGPRARSPEKVRRMASFLTPANK